MVTLGTGDFQYELSGTDWGNIPEEWTYREATSVDVDSDDRVYVFNRGTVPMIIFDAAGEIVDSWGGDVRCASWRAYRSRWFRLLYRRRGAQDHQTYP